jgi:DNA-binding response OmpR family regulator
MADGQLKRDVSSSHPGADIDGPALLWIDDELAPANIEIRYLQRQGYRVDYAVTGSNGLALARAGGYDGILLDLHLPDIPGLSVLATLRAENISTPVLVVTGFGDSESARVAGRFGANEFRAKPIFIDELELAVERLTRGPASEAPGSLKGRRNGRRTVTWLYRRRQAVGTPPSFVQAGPFVCAPVRFIQHDRRGAG